MAFIYLDYRLVRFLLNRTQHFIYEQLVNKVKPHRLFAPMGFLPLIFRRRPKYRLKRLVFQSQVDGLGPLRIQVMVG